MRMLGHGVRIGSLVWLVTHFVLTALYVIPPNPVNMALQPLLDATIGTYFGQNWSLFAPNPVSADTALLVRCLEPGESEPAVGQPSDDWYDISTPFWKAFQRNRFSPYDRLVRTQTSAIREFTGNSTVITEWRSACEKGTPGACETLDKLLKNDRTIAGAYLRRIGCAFCLAHSRSVSRVALRLRTTLTIPWSQRHDKVSRKVEDSDLESFPVEHDIETPSLYLHGELP